MKMFIPSLKSEITLLEDWHFSLHHEERNEVLFAHLGLPTASKWNYNDSSEPVQVSLPAGTTLIIDRIFIRQGAEGFDSVTFRIKGVSARPAPNQWNTNKTGDVARRQVRFWAKLDDVNNIVFEPTVS